MNKLLISLAAGLALSGAASATTRVISANGDTPSVVVRYGDLNLNSHYGATKMVARLRRAAHDVCVRFDNRVLGLRDQYETCVSDAITRGARDVGNDNLTRLISQRG